MPKPKKKRVTKATVPKTDPSESSPGTAGVHGSTMLPFLSTPEERESFTLPDISAIKAKLKLDLERESNPSLCLELYNLALQELEAARDKGTRLYGIQNSSGELFNPEDLEQYAGRLVDLIAKLSLERKRLQLELGRKTLQAPLNSEPPAIKHPTLVVDSFVSGSTPKQYPDVMTSEEVAEFLRFKLKRFYQVYKKLGIPHFREGHFLRFVKADIYKWAKRHSANSSNPTA
jgi:hypothetical protein